MANVTLISWTNEPLKTIASQVLNMGGDMASNLSEITDEEAEHIVEQLTHTKLNGAFEFVDFIFQLDGVPRSFTHQLVRHRVGASYSQESMRFVAKTGAQFSFETGPSIAENGVLSELYNQIMWTIQDGYETLLKHGAQTQDARGVLPTDILTRIGCKLNLKTIMNIAEVRLCYQAQPFWKDIITQMKQEIDTKVSPLLAKLLVRACDRTGKCEFRAEFDRECPVRIQLEERLCDGCYLLQTCRDNNRMCRAKEKYVIG